MLLLNFLSERKNFHLTTWFKKSRLKYLSQVRFIDLLHKMSSDEEIVSYSEEEIDEQQSSDLEEGNTENDAAIAAILEENEILEKEDIPNQEKRTASGKHRAPKVAANQTVVQTSSTDLFESLRLLQEEVNALKRSKKAPVGATAKKPKVDVDFVTNDDTASPQCSKTGSLQQSKQLRLRVRPSTSKQLSSDPKNQLSPVKSVQQLSSARSKQLSPAKIPSAAPALPLHNQSDDSGDDELALHPHAADDPLALEVNAESEGESSEDEGDDIFEDLVGAISIGGDDELLTGEPLPTTWAAKLNTAWKTKIPKQSYTVIQQKYRTPNNLTDFRIPRMNKDIWDLCSKWHKKADLNMSGSQRALVKAATAVLKLHDYFSNQDRSVRHIAMQTTADIVSLLGKVNRELSVRRKQATRPVLQGDYKKLANSTSVTEHLFGDNITQDIKDINTKRKIGAHGFQRNYGTHSQYRGGNYRGNNYRGNNYDNHFLWNRRGRGRQQHRASHTTTTYNNNRQYPKKH